MLRQAEWVTRMSRLAAIEYGADWVIPSDADELWWPRAGSFHEILGGGPSAVRGRPRSHAPLRPASGRRAAVRAPDGSRAPDGRPPEPVPRPGEGRAPRRAGRYGRDVGNHDVEGTGLRLLREWFPFEVLHFPLRRRASARGQVPTARDLGRRAAHRARARRCSSTGRADELSRRGRSSTSGGSRAVSATARSFGTSGCATRFAYSRETGIAAVPGAADPGRRRGSGRRRACRARARLRGALEERRCAALEHAVAVLEQRASARDRVPAGSGGGAAAAGSPGTILRVGRRLPDGGAPVSARRVHQRPDIPVTPIRPARRSVLPDFAGALALPRPRFTFAWRDVKVRYKQSLIGVLWAVLQPFLTMVVFTIIFGKFANFPSEGLQYTTFVYTGLVPWALFASTFTLCSSSVVANRALVQRVYFPRLDHAAVDDPRPARRLLLLVRRRDRRHDLLRRRAAVDGDLRALLPRSCSASRRSGAGSFLSVVNVRCSSSPGATSRCATSSRRSASPGRCSSRS